MGGPEGDILVGEVLWVDHFGNLQLNLDPDDLNALDGLDRPDGALTLRYGDTTRRVDRVRTFDEIPAGGVGLLIDSYGLLCIAVARGSAADELRLGESEQVQLAMATDAPIGVTTPVELGKR